MACTEFPVDLGMEGVGTLFVADAAILVRPRKVPGQYPSSVAHDTVRSYNILCLGNDMGSTITHIISRLDLEETRNILDRVFYAFVDACCHQLWCDARVCYIVDGDIVHVEQYGFEDGQYTMSFNVYCGIAEDQTDELLATLTADQTDPFVVVRPDLSELGYNVHGFTVDESDVDEIDVEPYGSEDDEDDQCPDGCGQPVYACTCAEWASLRRYLATPLEDRAGPWTA